MPGEPARASAHRAGSSSLRWRKRTPWFRTISRPAQFHTRKVGSPRRRAASAPCAGSCTAPSLRFRAGPERSMRRRPRMPGGHERTGARLAPSSGTCAFFRSRSARSCRRKARFTGVPDGFLGCPTPLPRTDWVGWCRSSRRASMGSGPFGRIRAEGADALERAPSMGLRFERRRLCPGEPYLTPARYSVASARIRGYFRQPPGANQRELQSNRPDRLLPGAIAWSER